MDHIKTLNNEFWDDPALRPTTFVFYIATVKTLTGSTFRPWFCVPYNPGITPNSQPEFLQ